jgi:predicted GIY-YIG superfamily endonuclease
MSTTPKTIQIFLPGGDPRGVRVAEITTRIVQVIEVPRSLLQEFLKMQESGQVAVYFLVGESDEEGRQKVYIGQTGDLRVRLADHHKKKDFWERALVLISRTNSLTQTHALFLEWHCLQAVRKASRYVDENGNSGSKPHTPAPLEADCREIFETGQVLLSSLGYPIFDPVGKPSVGAKNDEMFFLSSAGVNAKGRYTSEGFVVLKGSKGRKVNQPSLAKSMVKQRKKLLESDSVKVTGTTFEFIKDRLFGTPSQAGVAVLGRHTNGWAEWKSADGKTLDAVKRQA